MNDPSKILSAIQSARPLDLILLSFVLLPFILSQWADFGQSMRMPGWLILMACLLVVVLYTAILYRLIYETREDLRYEIAFQRIASYLKDKGFRSMSFKRVAENINTDYTPAVLDRLVDRYPGELRKIARMGSNSSDPGGPGIGLLNASPDNDGNG